MRSNGRIAGLLVLLVAAGALLVLNLRSSQAQTGNSGESFAVGGITTLDGHLAFSAHISPKGNIAGHVVQDSAGISRSGPVTCVTVNNSCATVQWQVKQSDNSGEINQYREFDVTDGGEPTLGMSPDRYTDKGCNNSCSFSGAFCVPVHGNIVVKDGTP
jgi:hypothetical protein